MVVGAVVFDMDGTINISKKYYDAYEKYALPIIADTLNLAEEEVQSKMKELRSIALGFTRRVELMGVPRLLFYDHMAVRIPCKDLIEPDPKMRLMLEELKNMEYKMALLTNTGRPLVDKILEALELPAELLDVIATSTDTGLKPDDEPYIYVANKLGLSLEECVYVGDRFEMEIETAEKLGMMTIMLGNSLLEDSIRKGHSGYTVDSIYNIPKILRGIRDNEANVTSGSNSLRTNSIPF